VGDTTHLFGDSTRINLGSTTPVADTTHPNRSRLSGSAVGNAPYTPSKNPDLALLFSAVVPGAGQVYNGHYWKVPVIWGFEGYWLSQALQNNKLYKQYRSAFAETVYQVPPLGDPTLEGLRNYYRDQRDNFYWYMSALYLANLVDAYVSAHLYDFDVSPNLGPQGQPGLMLQYKLH
jgi:hypothetical protein